MNSKTVWVVERGEYSDYCVVGVFSSKEKAEAACAITGETVAEWPIDPYCEEWIQGRKPYYLHMGRDGTASHISINDSLSGGSEHPPRIYGKMTYADGTPNPSKMVGIFWATDEQHAVKIANEHRIRAIANGEWPDDK